ncbi:MAG: hypothetical protein GC190_21175 [Alphaproteobacteria bacterium]|nr:hypothetical protein [Alphaproteobacteria bacterium]
MERVVHEIGIATIAATISCAVVPLLLFGNELFSHGPGALPAAIALMLGSAFAYLWYVLPIVYLMLPLLALTQHRSLVYRAASIGAAPIVVVAIYASPEFTWEALRPLSEHVEMAVSLVTAACILYYPVGRWMPAAR